MEISISSLIPAVQMLIYHFKYLTLFMLVIIIIIAYLHIKSSKHVYLLDFICYLAPDKNRAPASSFIEYLYHNENYDTKTAEFVTKVTERSGIGNESYVPDSLTFLPSDHSLNWAMIELETVVFSTVSNLLSKHKICPRSIDILVTNCNLMCPVPSIAVIIVNKFGHRSNVKSFNLSGMGCSAGLLSISLAKDLLRTHKDSTALVMSMESVSSNIYEGQMKSMLLANCLFRKGGVAILLTDKPEHRKIAKYQLQNLTRTHLGSKDNAYRCVFQEADEKGHIGVGLSRAILQIASGAMKMNLTTLAALVLPYSEMLKYGFYQLWRTKSGAYTPDFHKAFEHFCLHAGGKAVIDGIKESLKLTERDVEASKMTLYRFGNTSSSSIWYSLGYLEAKGRVKKGDRVWQLGFGSGFKCNSAVWKCISKMKTENCNNVWSDFVHWYPVEVPEVLDH